MAGIGLAGTIRRNDRAAHVRRRLRPTAPRLRAICRSRLRENRALRLDGKQRTAEILPLDVLHQRVGFQPRLLSGNRAEEVIEKLGVLSRPFKTEIRNMDGKYSIDFTGVDK